MNKLIKRPELPCYVIKKQFADAYFSVHGLNGRKTVVAFKDKEHALMFKRWYFDINIKDVKKIKTVAIEKIEIGFLERTCKVTSLDLMIYNTDNSIIRYEALNDVNDDIIFALENRFRYGS